MGTLDAVIPFATVTYIWSVFLTIINPNTLESFAGEAFLGMSTDSYAKICTYLVGMLNDFFVELVALQSCKLITVVSLSFNLLTSLFLFFPNISIAF